MSKQNIGVIGLAVMGENLVLNIESRGYSVAVYNRTAQKTANFINSKAKNKNIVGTYSFKELVDSLEKPRKIMLMVKAGKPVDDNINCLLPLLDKGDLIIDGGNSFFKDTIRRYQELESKGINYIGTGVSGGEEGALKGPAIMPGGKIEAYKMVENIFKDIAAKAEDNVPCVDWIGPDGAGHFVKMVHNGIEYGDMQLIGECVWTLKNVLGLSSDKISDIIGSWNSQADVLRSYLIEITAEGLKEKEKSSGKYLVDRTADITRMKGTGTWTIQSALELLIPVPTIAAAVFSREMSQDKNLRLNISSKMKMDFENQPPSDIKVEDFIEMAHDALYIAKISSYAQGFALLTAASDFYKFNLNLAEIARGWRAGCIVRAQFLNEITRQYLNNPDVENLILLPEFSNFICKNLHKLAKFISIAHRFGVPVLAMSGSYDYILQLLSAVMISAQVAAQQRDYFGAHGYFKLEDDSPKILKDADGKQIEFHTEWMLPDRPEIEI